MTITEKIADVKTVLAKIESGWKNKCIFQVEGIDYRYPFNETGNDGGEVWDGWATIIFHLADLLGFEDVGRDENGVRGFKNCFIDQQEIWNLMEQAKGFISLMETPIVKDRSKRIKIS